MTKKLKTTTLIRPVTSGISFLCPPFSSPAPVLHPPLTSTSLDPVANRELRGDVVQAITAASHNPNSQSNKQLKKTQQIHKTMQIITVKTCNTSTNKTK